MIYKTIICLANSRKLGGRCVAGKDVKNHSWIRPVSASQTGELTEAQISDSKGQMPQVLDILKIPLYKQMSRLHQPENWEISGNKWEIIDKYKANLDKLCDGAATIFINEIGHNDRISIHNPELKQLKQSLLFVRVYNVKIIRNNFIEEDGAVRKKIRVKFKYKSIDYDLAVTDVDIENQYKSKDEGEYDLNFKGIYICVSIGEPFNEYYYKLASAIIC